MRSLKKMMKFHLLGLEHYSQQAHFLTSSNVLCYSLKVINKLGKSTSLLKPGNSIFG